MRLHIAAIGKGGKSGEHALAEKWFARLPPNHRGSIHVKTAQSQPDESTAILGVLASMKNPGDALLIALDNSGTDTASQELAAMIARHRDDGKRDAVFAIGGADGHHPSLLARAHATIAFGRATWPHLLCRAMLAEQLYRAEMILSRHPYHHG